MPTPNYDAVVVGARVAGSATAMLLGRAGLKVLLIERQSYGSDTLSTHALMRGGVLQLARWGLLRDLLARQTPLVTQTSFHYGDEEIGIQLRTDATVPGLVAPRRTVLDPLLVDAAIAGGVEVRFGTMLREVIRTARGRVIGVGLEGPDGHPPTVMTGILVGADGLGSTTARLVGARMLRTGTASASNVYGYVPGHGDGAFHWHYRVGTGGQSPFSAGIIPTNDGRSCVFISHPTAAFDTVVRHDVTRAYHAALEAIGGDVADRARATPPTLSVFRGRAGYLRQTAGPGWLLVGDAGFFRDPLTAHGITDALRDAEATAAAVVAGSDAAACRYQAERDRIAGALLETTDAIVRFDWDYPQLQAHHRRLNAIMKDEVALLAQRQEEVHADAAAGTPGPRRRTGEAAPSRPHMVLVSPPST